MKNKEKYAKEIVEIACDGYGLAVNNRTGKPVPCYKLTCSECLFECDGCEGERIRVWAESEYIEKPVISKKDRAFLEYLGEEMEYIARDIDGRLVAYECVDEKEGGCWKVNVDCSSVKPLYGLNIQFPMIKWNDSEAWLIEDLKKLEVVEDYE